MGAKVLDIIPIHALKDNYIWVIVDNKSHCAAVVDPGESKLVTDFLSSNQLNLVAVLITHHHFDHVNGVKELLSYHQVPVYGPKHENIPCCDHPLQDNDKIQLGDLSASFEAMELPGHTSGQIAYYGHGSVFTGDTLFSAGCGKMFEGTPEQFWHSLKRLMQLPEDTKMYCGHEYTLANLHFAKIVEPENAVIESYKEKVTKWYQQNKVTLPSTMGLEKQVNPFLRCGLPQVIEAAERQAGKKLTSSSEVFAVLRAWKDSL